MLFLVLFSSTHKTKIPFSHDVEANCTIFLTGVQRNLTCSEIWRNSVFKKKFIAPTSSLEYVLLEIAKAWCNFFIEGCNALSNVYRSLMCFEGNLNMWWGICAVLILCCLIYICDTISSNSKLFYLCRDIWSQDCSISAFIINCHSVAFKHNLHQLFFYSVPDKDVTISGFTFFISV